MPKLERQIPNPDKPEITTYKHHLILKLGQINSKSQIRSNANCLEFRISVIVVCLVLVFCYLKLLIAETRTPKPDTVRSLQHVVRKVLLGA